MDNTMDKVKRSRAPEFEEGMVFQERYEVLSLLGRGGFGHVYKCRQLTTDQPVALKVIRPVPSGTPSLERLHMRFLREMQLCAQLHHPNIVRLIDSGQAEDGRLYSVFSFVPGENLSRVLGAEQKLEPVEAAHLMGQVLDALSAAHDIGVVHRDLKPGNIMISPSGARRNALVLDFGIGICVKKSVDQELTHLTGSRDLVGTPSYAAPEQFKGGHPTPSADLYSWGLVFMECLTGQRVMEGTFMDVLYKQLGPEPVPIPKLLRRHPVGQILRQVTEKEPDQRVVTAGEVLQQLEQCDFSRLHRQVRHSEVIGKADTRDRSRDRTVSRRDVAAAATAETPWPSRASEEAYSWQFSGAERRQLTVVDCTFSFGDSSDIDLEDFERRFVPLCEEVAHRFGGLVGSLHGDQVKLYFGFPRAREDDARRAARAAMELVAGTKSGADSDKLAPVARVGVDTGMVIVRSSGENTPNLEGVVGMSPKIAAELGSAAQPNSVLVSGTTRKLLKQSFHFEPAGEITVGSLPPVPAFLLGPENVASTSLATLFSGDSHQMVGRDAELGLLRNYWQRSSGGHGQGVLIMGEAGIGKSRLVRELVREVNETSGTWQECHCSPESRNCTLQPIIEMLQRLMGFGSRWSDQQKVDALELLLLRHELELELELEMPLLSALLSLPPNPQYPPQELSAEVQKKLTLDTLESLLLQMASGQPLLLVVEDLHWCDPTTMELLAKLTGALPEEPLCLVMTARPDFATRFPPGRLQQIQLDRLAPDDVATLAQGIAGKPLPQEVLDEVARRTDGVALFVEELTSMLLDSRLLQPGEQRYELVGKLEELEIPATLRDLLAARVDRLGRAKETAQLASAVGREFSFELLAAVSPRERDVVRQDLQTLVDAGLVYRQRRKKELSYIFRHAMICDMAYDTLIRSGRQQAHSTIAAAMEEKFPELTASRPDLLAQHHAKAGQRRQALQYATQSGMMALQRSSYAEALGHAAQAREWLEELDDERQRALAELDLNGIMTPALMSVDGWGDPAIRATVERSQQLIESVGYAPDTMAHIMPNLCALAVYHHLQANREACRRLSEQMLAVGQHGADTATQVVALPFLATCHMEEGDFPGAVTQLEQAFRIHNRQMHRNLGVRFGMDPLANAHQLMGLLDVNMGHLDRALGQVQQGLQWAREVKHGAATSMGLFHLGLIHSIRQEPGPTLEYAGQGMELAQKYGLLAHQGYFAVLLGWGTNNIQMVRPVVEALEQRKLHLGLPHHRSLLAELEARQGNFEAALELMERSLVDSNNLSHLSVSLRLRGEYRLAQSGDAEAAEADFREALEAGQRHGARLHELQAAVSLGRLLLQRDHAPEAATLLRPLYDGFSEGLQTPPLLQAQELLGQLEGGSGPPT